MRFQVKIYLVFNAHVLSQLFVVSLEQRVRRFGGTLPQQVQELDGSQLCVIVSQVLRNDGFELQDIRSEENCLFGQGLNI